MKRLYGIIQKSEELDDGTLIVEGIASSEAVDSDGEIITAEAMKTALPDYMKFANIREMHQAKAAGVALSADVDANGVTKIVAHIVDSEAIKKVLAGVYKGFSIGAKILKRDMLKTNIITALRLKEISLVDRPANPEALLTCWKGEDIMDKNDEGQTDDVKKSDVQHPAPLDTSTQADNQANNQPHDLNEGKVLGDVDPKLVENDSNDVVDDEGMKADSVVAAVEASPEVDPATGKDIAKSDEVAKGLWNVADLADVVQKLKWLCQDAQFESEIEGDNSAVPAMLRDALKSLVAAFKEMAVEEADEAATDAGAVDEVQLMEKVSKLVADEVAKVSKAGADEIAKRDSEIATLKEQVEKLKAMPAPAKGVTKAVSADKAADSVYKADDTGTVAKIDSPLDAVKAAHATGGFKIQAGVV